MASCNMKNKTKQQKKSTKEQSKYSDTTACPYEVQIQPRQVLPVKRFPEQIFKKDTWEASIPTSFRFNGENKNVFHKARKSNFLLIRKILTRLRRQC